MFKKTLLACAVAITSMTAMIPSAHADFISSDFLTSGDNRVVVDQDTGIEWLSLLVTDGQSFNQATARLAEGGDLFGWRLPTYDEYASMFTDFFDLDISQAYLNGRVSAQNRAEWFDLFGQTYADRSAGYFTKANGSISISGAFTSNTVIGTAYSPYSHATAYGHYGTYLVSDGGISFGSISNPGLNVNNPNAPESASVPVPASLGLLGLGLLGFTSLRKRKKSNV